MLLLRGINELILSCAVQLYGNKRAAEMRMERNESILYKRIWVAVTFMGRLEKLQNPH